MTHGPTKPTAVISDATGNRATLALVDGDYVQRTQDAEVRRLLEQILVTQLEILAAIRATIPAGVNLSPGV